MIKNGLFFISLGLLIFVVGAIGRETMALQDFSLFIVALSFVILGGVLFYKGNKKEKEKKQEEEDSK